MTPYAYGPILIVIAASLNAALKGQTGIPVGILVLGLGMAALILVDLIKSKS